MATWKTIDEINFLKKIGTHFPKEHMNLRPKVKKVYRLQKYLKANNKRANWGPLDKEAILTFCEGEIHRLGGKNE